MPEKKNKVINTLRKQLVQDLRPKYFLSFDVENDINTGNFICAGLYGKYKSKKSDNILTVEEYFTDIEKFQEAILFYGKVPNLFFTTYNLNYDEAFIREITNDSGTMRTSDRVIKLEVLSGGVVFDIQNITGIEYSLENWIEWLDMEKKYGVKKVSLENLYNRVMNDTKATWILSDFIQNYFINTWNSRLKFTVGSCALEIFKNSYLPFTINREICKCKNMQYKKCNNLRCWEDKDKCEKYENINGLCIHEINKDCNKLDCYYMNIENECINYRENEDFNGLIQLERKSFRGGRNEIFKRGWLDVLSYDVKSMYVSIMRDEEIPIPDKYNYVKNPDERWREYFEKYLGIYDVTVYVPMMKLAPLPVRAKVDGVFKVIYPTGTFRGVWTNKELKEAEKYGVKILTVHEFVYYYKSMKLFKEYALDIWEKRTLHSNKCYQKLKGYCNKCQYEDVKNCVYSLKNPDYNKALDTMSKKLGNSLFGKFSQGVYEISYFGREEDLTEELIELIKTPGKCKVNSFEYMNELYFSIKSNEKVNSLHTFTVISSFITSYARIKWFKHAKPVEYDLVYGDTDSIKILNGNYLLDSGVELGDFAYEYHKVQPFYAPKAYGSWEEIDEKIKGVKKNNKKQPDRTKLIADNKLDGIRSYTFESPIKFRTAIRSKDKYKMAQWVQLTKSIEVFDDKRIWFGEKFYNRGVDSVPFNINTLDNEIIEINTDEIYKEQGLYTYSFI